MRMVDLIKKKRDGGELSQQEINFIITGYTKAAIPDYQMAALAMAIYFQGMTSAERVHLTLAMAHSGDRVDLTAIKGIKVDKHSTGGVGDTTTLVLAPLVASVGVPVAKMSGRGLGHTGGTIDKLEAVPGFQVELANQQFIDLVNKNKVAVVGQSGNLTPADKKLYSLRDVTATVESIPLIASSIMSKKIAAGADAIVLDVKTGSGAFMKDLSDAQALAQAMVEIGNSVGKRTVAVISDMSQPLGYAVGNALEVEEAIATLRGAGPPDLRELCLVLGSQMVYLAGGADTPPQARQMLEQSLADGRALQTFKSFLAAQGADVSGVDDATQWPQAKDKFAVTAPKTGVVAAIKAAEIGTVAMLLGAGRATKEATIDLAVGIVLHKKIGDPVHAGQPIATIHSNGAGVEELGQRVQEAYTITSQPVKKPPLIHQLIEEI